jgi:hypothetical protein
MSAAPMSCFLRGTRILIDKSEMPVEGLTVGDLVVTERGTSLPVKWIGRRRFKQDVASNWPKDFMPVRVSRHALDGRTPHTDLYLSPNHMLFIDGVLIPVKYLINGVSIAQAVPNSLQQIEYFHIELETHEVIFAEGAAVETLLVTTDREGFDNFVEYERLYGKNNRQTMTPYAPIVCYNGRRSELIRLLRRAASTVVDARNPIQVAFDRIAARAREVVG